MKQATRPVAPVTRLAPRAALALHIDRVVLEGFALGARDRARLQTALQTELAQLLLVNEARPSGGAALARLDAGALRVEPGGDPDRLGRALARSLHTSIVR